MVSFFPAYASTTQVVNVFSYRQPFLTKSLFNEFTQKTGIEVRMIFAQKGLIERIQIADKRSPADVILTTDISRLVQAGETIAQPVYSPSLIKHIPQQFRSKDHLWFGLTQRARVAFVSRDRVSEKDITYEELSTPKWKNRVCSRSGQHAYNLALFASQIAHHGKQKTVQWLQGFKNNLSQKPTGNDRAQIRLIYAGKCDIALANTYYMGKMQTNHKKTEQKKWAKSVRLIYPNRLTTGTHVNLSGMVMAKYAPHKENALKLMEFLVSKKAQRIYAEVNFEYPIRPSVPVSPLVASWGSLKSDTLSLETLAKLTKSASYMVDKVRFNH